MSVFKISITLVISVGIGSILGVLLDKYLGLTPLFLIVCAILGFVAGFMIVIKK